MSEHSSIEWTEHTGGPWLGCTEVSPGCGHCYARELMQRRLKSIVRKAYRAAGFADWETRPVWGDKAPRVLTKGFWDDAERINAAHAKAGTRGRWFPSMIDWLDLAPAGIISQDGEWLNIDAVLADFLDLIRRTPHLDWQLLTKRPQNWADRVQDVLRIKNLVDATKLANQIETRGMLLRWLLHREAPANVWLGTTVEDQPRADERIPLLLSIPARVRFLSCEPLLGLVDLTPWLWGRETPCQDCTKDADCGCGFIPRIQMVQERSISWVIAGGESGHGARPAHPDWFRSLRNQCQAAGVPFLFKQWGEWFPDVAKDRYLATLLGDQIVSRVGKKAAGRLLDGREWNEFPTPAAQPQPV